jgi:hypothetical protein
LSIGRKFGRASLLPLRSPLSFEPLRPRRPLRCPILPGAGPRSFESTPAPVLPPLAAVAARLSHRPSSTRGKPTATDSMRPWARHPVPCCCFSPSAWTREPPSSCSHPSCESLETACRFPHPPSRNSKRTARNSFPSSPTREPTSRSYFRACSIHVPTCRSYFRACSIHEPTARNHVLAGRSSERDDFDSNRHARSSKRTANDFGTDDKKKWRR